MFFYWFARPLLFVFMKLFYPFKAIGVRNSTLNGSTVIISNHLSGYDAFLVGYNWRKRTYFLCKKEMFKNKILGWMIKHLGAISIDRDKIEINELKHCLSLLKSGETIAVFPEGTRNRTSEPLIEFKSGAGVFAVKGKANVIPVYIYGKSKLFRKNYVCVGNEFSLEEYYGKKLTEDVLEEINERFRSELLALRDEVERTIPEKKLKKLRVNNIEGK